MAQSHPRDGKRTLEAMSRSIGADLPAGVLELLDGDDLPDKHGLTFLLLTVTEDGWPHVAMLSVGELLAVSPKRLRAALWPESTATRNLAASGRATIALVHGGAGYYLRCEARRGPDLELESSPAGLAFFELEIHDILEDTVPYATLTSGTTFVLADPGESMARWEDRITALRTAR